MKQLSKFKIYQKKLNIIIPIKLYLKFSRFYDGEKISAFCSLSKEWDNTNSFKEFELIKTIEDL